MSIITRSFAAADNMAWKFLISLVVILILPVLYALDGLDDEIGQQETEQQDTLDGMWNSGKGPKGLVRF